MLKMVSAVIFQGTSLEAMGETRGQSAIFLDTVNSYYFFYSQLDSFLFHHMDKSPSFENLLKTKREMMVITARMVDSAAATP